MSYNILESRTYTLFISSADKVSGTNNNATFFVDWVQFLPQNYNEYKMIFSFQTVGGYYKDTPASAIYSSAKVAVNFGSRQFSYDTSTKTTSNTIGYISRDVQTTATNSNVLSSFYYQYPAKTMTRPRDNFMTVNITNMYSGVPLVTTDAAGAAQSDMTAWQMCLEFIPIHSSLIGDIKGQNM
jgi:AAA15 family ATPase/GTPase